MTPHALIRLCTLSTLLAACTPTADTESDIDTSSETDTDADTDADSDSDSDSDTDTDTDTDTDVEPSPPPRMVYMSLWATGVGRLTFEPESHHYQALGDAKKTQMALDFIAEQQVTEVAFYNMRAVLTDPGRTASLSAFIKKARGLGVERAIAIGSNNAAFDRIATYQTNALRDDPDASFDGMLTEIEFWQTEGDYDAYIDTLDHMGALNLLNRDGEPLMLATYQGWLHKTPGVAERCGNPDLDDAGCIAEMVSQRVDRVLLHTYTNTPETAPTYGEDRFEHYRNASKPVQLLPIFAFEDPEFSAGTEYFSGEWLCKNKDGGLAGAEDVFNANAAIPAEGFAHYSYFFADMYLNYVECP
ncbi:MAG: hypothetical protein AB8H79_17915 [Myxococcota bacterium]